MWLYLEVTLQTYHRPSRPRPKRAQHSGKIALVRWTQFRHKYFPRMRYVILLQTFLKLSSRQYLQKNVLSSISLPRVYKCSTTMFSKHLSYYLLSESVTFSENGCQRYHRMPPPGRCLSTGWRWGFLVIVNTPTWINGCLRADFQATPFQPIPTWQRIKDKC